MIELMEKYYKKKVFFRVCEIEKRRFVVVFGLYNFKSEVYFTDLSGRLSVTVKSKRSIISASKRLQISRVQTHY